MTASVLFWGLLGITYTEAKASEQLGSLRVSALTPRLLRIENVGDNGEEPISRNTVFGINAKKLKLEEASSQVRDDLILELDTEYLSVRYDKSKGIGKGLTVRLKEPVKGRIDHVWRPTDRNTGQLPGTIRTLDGINGGISLNCDDVDRFDLRCQMGIISRLGWVVIDDTSAYLTNGVATTRKTNRSDPHLIGTFSGTVWITLERCKIS